MSADKLPNNEVYFRIEADKMRRKDVCHVFDAKTNECLGLLPVLSVTTKMDYSHGFPVTTIEIVANEYVMETMHRLVSS